MSNQTEKKAITNEKDGSVMVYVPEGTFLMGVEKDSVRVDAFYIDKFPITNNQYKVFMEEANCEELLSGKIKDLTTHINL